MIKKVDILGIQLDNYTVREAIMCVERFLSNNVLNTIESISLQMLIDSETNPVLKEVMSSLDLSIIGEKEIIQAAGLESMQRIRETEENDFYFEFFKWSLVATPIIVVMLFGSLIWFNKWNGRTNME